MACAGYYTSRPSTKLLARVASGYLRAARQLQLAARRRPPASAQPLQRLTQTVALMQHHDAITGTDRAEVNQDYRRQLAAGAGAAFVAPGPVVLDCNTWKCS